MIKVQFNYTIRKMYRAHHELNLKKVIKGNKRVPTYYQYQKKNNQ